MTADQPPSRLTRALLWALLLLIVLIGCLAILLPSLTWRPPASEAAAYRCPAQTPELVPGQPLKVMTWNVQYLAGKRYVFWYDQPDGNGPDQRPTAQDLAFTLDEVARVIRDEAPDLVLLQDLDENAKATDYTDQLELLQERLSDLYPCHAQAFDWKSDFVPDRHILGSVGRKLATLSRYRIAHADRLQLPIPQADIIRRQFQPKRALLVSYLPLQGGGQLAVYNTQLDKPLGADDTAQRQAEKILRQLDRTESHGMPWLLGGNFNLLPLGQYQRLPADKRDDYQADSQLHVLWEKYPMVPSNAETSGEDRTDWLTYFPNDPDLQAPDRTLDYIFHSPALKRVDAAVRQDDTLGISNHLPLMVTFELPAAKKVAE